MGYIPPNFLDYTAIFRNIFKSVFSLLWGNCSKYLLVHTLDYNWLKTAAAADFLFDNKSQWIWAKNSGASKRYKMATTAIAATRWRSQKYFLRLKSLLLQKHEMSVIMLRRTTTTVATVRSRFGAYWALKIYQKGAIIWDYY